MARLTWIRERDGETPNGRPCYEYKASGKDGCRYHIVYAYDSGGQFGYTAIGPDGEYLTARWGIHWARTLGWCQDECNKIERGRPVHFVPSAKGET